LYPHAKFLCWGFENVGLDPPKSQKLEIFGISLAKRGVVKRGQERIIGTVGCPQAILWHAEAIL